MSVYYVHAPELGLMKIGFALDPKGRFSKIQSDSPTRLVMLAVEDGHCEVEAQRHEQFAHLRQRGEWFKFEGALVDHVHALGPIPPKEPSLNKQIIALGLSKSYASQIVRGNFTPPINLAIRIFRETGWRHDCIANMPEADMAVFERHDPWTPKREAAA